jgi:hypothetical protein
MDTVKQFKNPPVIRDYWRVKKAEERARAKHALIIVPAG